MSVKKYFRTEIDEYDSGLAPVTVLAAHVACDDDEESSAASEYLNSVKREASSLPFAIEATNLQSLPTCSPELSKFSESSFPVDLRLAAAVIDYFQSVRELARSNSGEKRQILIEIEAGDADCSVLGVADFASITSALEEFAEFVEELDIETATEWIFAFLVYLDFPLLEDTAAALQMLVRYCVSRMAEHSKLLISAIVIRDYFKQRNA